MRVNFSQQRRKPKRIGILDLISIDCLDKRIDFFIQKILDKDLIKEFKKNKKALDRFVLIYPEHIVGFNYIKDLNKYLFPNFNKLRKKLISYSLRKNL